jgi:hypothetical protein
MKAAKKEFIFTTLFIGISLLTYSQSEDNINKIDSISSKKKLRQSRRRIEKENLKTHFYITANATFASIQSQLSFEPPSKLYRIQIDLEEHLGLVSSKWFFNTNIIYRITPGSGLFGQYYGLSRSSPIVLEEDIIFPGDTIKAGTLNSAFFDTQVFSLGYLLSILKEDKAFLGAYFNVYVMKIKTGITSDVFGVDERVDFFAPWPNFGLAMAFELRPWLNLSGNIGVFFINIDDHSGAIHDLTGTISFSPRPWIGINLGVTVFDLSIEVPDQQFKTFIDYTFSGPTVGLTFRF